jgi:hypothetical protein
MPVLPNYWGRQVIESAVQVNPAGASTLEAPALARCKCPAAVCGRGRGAGVHGEIFKDIRPVNTVMQVTRFIDPEWLVEIEVDAVIGDAD